MTQDVSRSLISDAARRFAAHFVTRRGEPWWVVRYKDGDHEVVRGESRVWARMVVEGRDGGTGHACGHPDHIGWIEGPFTRKPAPRVEWL